MSMPVSPSSYIDPRFFISVCPFSPSSRKLILFNVATLHSPTLQKYNIFMKMQSIVKRKTIKQVKKLNLSGQNLTEIPAYVFEYTNLTKLVLSRNSINKIPKEIAKLKKLEVLDLTYNNLTEIPAPVFKLPKLRVLSVGHNKLRKFPKQLVSSSIEQLIADHNQIGELDAAALDNLTKLILSYNPLGGQVVSHKLEKLLYYDFRHTNLSTPDSKLLPDDCKGYVPIHKAEITDEMYFTKMMYDFSKNSDDMKATNGTIFISHSSKDKALVEEFVDEILQLGMGIDAERISCTSIEEMGIPNGTKMREWIQEKIVDCKVAFLMISPYYKKSEICLNEMGAVWALDKDVKILLLPGIDYGNFGWLEEIRQAGHIESEGVLDQLYDDLREEFGSDKKVSEWGRHKKKFLDYCKKLPKKEPDAKETEATEREKTDKIYLEYCAQIFDYLRYWKFPVWAGMLVGARPRIVTKLLEDFELLVSYLDSRAKYEGYNRFDELFYALSLNINDLVDVFNLYAEGKEEVSTIRAFYREGPHNPRYHEDLEDYNAYVAFIYNLTYELTRICNDILAEARHLMIEFMSDYGVFTIDGIGHKGDVVVKFEYESGELYKGLDDFIETAMNRKYHMNFDTKRVRKVLSDILMDQQFHK